MPNRVLRDWTTSDSMNRLSLGAEVFFTRLIMKADDYGSFHGNPKLLNAALFPLKDYSTPEVNEWLRECLECRLITHYQSDGKDYIRIENFGQRLRAMRNIFPQPADNPLTSGGQPADNWPPETKRNEVETETKQKGKEPDFEQFDRWTEDIISGNDYIFSQQWRNEFPNWGGGPEKFAEVVKDHLQLLNRYPNMNPNTQGRFRASVMKHFREYKSKPNGTGNKKGIDVNAALDHIAKHGAGGEG